MLLWRAMRHKLRSMHGSCRLQHTSSCSTHHLITCVSRTYVKQCQSVLSMLLLLLVLLLLLLVLRL